MLNMCRFFQPLLLLITVYLAAGLLMQAVADDFSSDQSTRIEVYSLSQNYWDTRYGDTLSDIVLHLLPDNPSKHATLKLAIVKLNPHAFINDNPSRLLAGKRLWLPGYMKHADTRANPATTTVETYSWRNIKRSKK